MGLFERIKKIVGGNNKKDQIANKHDKKIEWPKNGEVIKVKSREELVLLELCALWGGADLEKIEKERK